jgi:hypothetical protein
MTNPGDAVISITTAGSMPAQKNSALPVADF